MTVRHDHARTLPGGECPGSGAAAAMRRAAESRIHRIFHCHVLTPSALTIPPMRSTTRSATDPGAPADSLPALADAILRPPDGRRRAAAPGARLTVLRRDQLSPEGRGDAPNPDRRGNGGGQCCGSREPDAHRSMLHAGVDVETGAGKITTDPESAAGCDRRGPPRIARAGRQVPRRAVQVAGTARHRRHPDRREDRAVIRRKHPVPIAHPSRSPACMLAAAHCATQRIRHPLPQTSSHQ